MLNPGCSLQLALQTAICVHTIAVSNVLLVTPGILNWVSAMVSLSQRHEFFARPLHMSTVLLHVRSPVLFDRNIALEFVQIFLHDAISSCHQMTSVCFSVFDRNPASDDVHRMWFRVG